MKRECVANTLHLKWLLCQGQAPKPAGFMTSCCSGEGAGVRTSPLSQPHTPLWTLPLAQHHKHSLHEGSECLFLWMYLEPLTSNEIFHFPLPFLSGGNAGHQHNRILGKPAPKSNLHFPTLSSPSPLPQGTCRRVALANSPALCPVLLPSTSEIGFLPFPMGDLVPVYHLWHL